MLQFCHCLPALNFVSTSIVSHGLSICTFLAELRLILDATRMLVKSPIIHSVISALTTLFIQCPKWLSGFEMRGLVHHAPRRSIRPGMHAQERRIGEVGCQRLCCNYPTLAPFTPTKTRPVI